MIKPQVLAAVTAAISTYLEYEAGIGRGRLPGRDLVPAIVAAITAYLEDEASTGQSGRLTSRDMVPVIAAAVSAYLAEEAQNERSASPSSRTSGQESAHWRYFGRQEVMRARLQWHSRIRRVK